MAEEITESTGTGKKATLIGALVDAFLVLLKLAAGLQGKSQALIVDAVHSVSDLFTDAVVLLGLRIGRKAPDAEHPFGHARLETLASATVGLALIVTALYLGIDAIWDISLGKETHPTALALLGAGVSVALKEALFHYSINIGRRIRSPAVVANAWHHRSDALSSVAVLLGVTGTLIKPSWNILDSYAALVVSFFIVKVGLEISRDSLLEFTDAAPQPEVLDRISRCARGVEGVIDIHDLRVRITGGQYQMETHIVVDGAMSVTEGHRIAKKVESRLEEEVAELDRAIIHVDPAEEEPEVSQQPQAGLTP